MTWRASIKGLQEVQAKNLKMINALKPHGQYGEAIRWATTEAHRYSVQITHVDTGTLRAGQRLEVMLGRLSGLIYIDPQAINPKSGALASRYGLAEHARGGSHAFYERVLFERGQHIGTNALRIVERGL